MPRKIRAVDMHHVSFRTPEWVYQALCDYAGRNGLDLSGVLNMVLVRGLPAFLLAEQQIAKSLQEAMRPWEAPPDGQEN